MSTIPRAITVRATLDVLETGAGPNEALYAFVLENGQPYKFVPNSTATADGFAVLSVSGGQAGRWHILRESLRGAALTNADATIYVGGGRRRVLPAATLDANHTLTLGTTNGADGDWIEVVRLDATAFTYAVVNGGAGAGTLLTFPISKRYWARFHFDGTNWSPEAAGEIPT